MTIKKINKRTQLIQSALRSRYEQLAGDIQAATNGSLDLEGLVKLKSELAKPIKISDTLSIPVEDCHPSTGIYKNALPRGYQSDLTAVTKTIIQAQATQPSTPTQTVMPEMWIKSPKRSPLHIEKGVLKTAHGVNPELLGNPRTRELATDQSISARHLIYEPGSTSIQVVERCADGVAEVIKRLTPSAAENSEDSLAKNETLISMSARLMSDGGLRPINEFNSRLGALVAMKKEDPVPANYATMVSALAVECRTNMSSMLISSKIPGQDGALARQGLLGFMGDLGGLEPKETGYGSAFKGPLGDPGRVYTAYVDGLCVTQRNLAGNTTPPTIDELRAFSESFNQARLATAAKGGVLSAPTHTAGKKIERAPMDWQVAERQGLHNTGTAAEEKLHNMDQAHQSTLKNASWPVYYISDEIVRDVVEPVTGHVSGTFGEMALTMNMFCGTSPTSVSREQPAGVPTVPGKDGQDVTSSIAALAAAGLMTAGFHSAVEIYQPLTTFGTHAIHEALGPKAIENDIIRITALREHAEFLNDPATGKQLPIDDPDFGLTTTQLLTKARSIEDAATKSQDMMSLLQGGGGTLATIELCHMIDNHSSSPMATRELYSLATRVESLGQRMSTPELKEAQAIAQRSPSGDIGSLERAIQKAEKAADLIDELRAATKVQPSPTTPSNHDADLSAQRTMKAKMQELRDANPANAVEAEPTVTHKYSG